jgi:hypothetical protein
MLRLVLLALVWLAASGCITDLLCGPSSSSNPTRGQVIDRVGWAACQHQRGCTPKEFEHQTIAQCVDSMKAREKNQSAVSNATADEVTACEHALPDATCGGVPKECTHLLE